MTEQNQQGQQPGGTANTQDSSQASQQAGGGEKGNNQAPPPANADPWEAEDWQKNVPEKFRDEKGEIKLKDLAKSYVNAEKRLGSGDAPPKTPEEYKLDYKLPEGVSLNKEAEKSFLAACHANGMTNKQVQFVMDKYTNILGEGIKAGAVTKEKAEAELKKAWGEGFQENMGLALKAFNALASEEDRAGINQIGNNPVLLKMLAKMGRELKEDTSPSGGAPQGISDEEIQTLMRSKAYFDPKEPEHQAVKAKVTAFYQRKFAKKAG